MLSGREVSFEGIDEKTRNTLGSKRKVVKKAYQGERYLLRGLMKRRNEQTVAAIDDKARTHNHTEKQSH